MILQAGNKIIIMRENVNPEYYINIELANFFTLMSKTVKYRLYPPYIETECIGIRQCGHFCDSGKTNCCRCRDYEDIMIDMRCEICKV